MSNKSQNNKLPLGWELTNLEAFTQIILGQSPPSSSYNTEQKGLPFFQGKAEFGDIYPTIQKWCSSPNKIAIENDVLISVRAPVGPTNLCPTKSCIGRGLAAIRPLDTIDSKYILYLLRRFESDIAKKGTGTTFKAISGDTLKSVKTPIAPLNEQRRIVAKIEELFSHLDAGVQALERAKALLKQYRQSVLKAAVTGELTRDWREQNKDKLEPADKLLARILTERRRKWEAQELAKMRAKGKEPKDDTWKQKYKSPAAPDTRDLPELPEGWCWATVEQFSWDSGYGTSAKCSYDFTGNPVLRIPNIQKSGLNLSDLKFASQQNAQNPNLVIKPGDLLLIRTNGSKNLIGRGAVVFKKLSKPHFFASYLIRFRLLGEMINWHWISSYWNSKIARNFILNIAATSAGQYNISLTNLNALPIPFPSTAEQTEIEKRLSERLIIVDRIEDSVNREIDRSYVIKQSILKDAFSGQLVSQYPNDEAASVLLERIKAEKAKMNVQKTKRPRKSTQQTATAQEK